MVGLLPVRTAPLYFHRHILGRATVWFIRGRLWFAGHAARAPFESMLVAWGGSKRLHVRLERALIKAGLVTATQIFGRRQDDTVPSRLAL